MNYKVMLVAVLFFLTHHQFHAQDEKSNLVVIKCNEKVDDFTGEIKVSVNQRRIVTIENEEVKAKANELWKKGVMVDYEMFVCALDAYRKGEVKGVNVYLKFNTTRPLDFYGLLTGESIMEFKLENDKIIKLNFIGITKPDINLKYKYSTYTSRLSLTNNDIKELGNSSISKIRIHFTEGYKSYDITENANLLIQQLKCVSPN